MKKSMLFLGLFVLFSDGFALDYEKIENTLNDKIKKEAAIELTINSCKPNQRITKLMSEIDEIAQTVTQEDPTDEKAIQLNLKCLALVAALRERRTYSYMLWAEGRLEASMQDKYASLSKLSQSTLLQLYISLSEINMSLITENMLNREIISRLAEIYDFMDADYKKQARVNAIHLQRDPLTVNLSRVRKTLDDF